MIEQTAEQKSLPFTVALANFGVLEISGPDSDKLLQGQLTIAPSAITPEHLSLGALCNPQGRCIAVFWATRFADSIRLVMPADNIETTQTSLQKYAVFYKTTISNKTETWPLFAVSGLQTPTFKPRFGDKQPIPLTNSPDLGLIFTAQGDSESGLDTDPAFKADDWLCQLISAKIPWVDDAAQSQFLPHNLGLPDLGAVDFKKGCFTGQEVIARMHYKGKLKSHLQRLTSDTSIPLKAGEKLTTDTGDNAGEVVCSAINSGGETAVLAIIKDRFLNAENFLAKEQNGPILRLN